VQPCFGQRHESRGHAFHLTYRLGAVRRWIRAESRRPRLEPATLDAVELTSAHSNVIFLHTSSSRRSLAQLLFVYFHCFDCSSCTSLSPQQLIDDNKRGWGEMRMCNQVRMSVTSDVTNPGTYHIGRSSIGWLLVRSVSVC